MREILVFGLVRKCPRRESNSRTRFGTPETRAARLGAMLKVTAGHPVLSVDEVMHYAPRHLTGVDVVHLEGVTDEDLALLNACMEVEYELREQGFAQAQRLLAFAAEGEGRARRALGQVAATRVRGGGRVPVRARLGYAEGVGACLDRTLKRVARIRVASALPLLLPYESMTN